MKFLFRSFVHLVLILIFDLIWINVFAGAFYAEQLKEIGRFTDNGDFNVRTTPALILYSIMALAIEVFIFRNKSLHSLKEHLVHGAFLGFTIYAVYDLTNRAVLEYYPLPMVVVDIFWGTVLFTAVTYCAFHLRRQVTLL